MGFDWQAFATGFLQQTAKNQTEAREDARNYEERQRELAERNSQTISKRRAVANQVVGLTNMLRDNGASQEVIQAAVSAGPQSVVELANKVNSARETLGRNLASDDIESLVNMPDGFSVIDMDTEDFIRKTYGLGYEGAGTSKETVERTFMDRLTGRKLRDAARARLDSEVMMDGLTAYDINQMAAQQDYESLVPGTFITFNEMKIFDPATDMASFSRTITSLVSDVEDSAEFERITNEMQQTRFSEDLDEKQIKARLAELQAEKDALYLRNVKPTIDSMVSTYGDSFLDATDGYLRSFLSDSYVDSLSFEPEEDEEAEPAEQEAEVTDDLTKAVPDMPDDTVTQTSAAVDDGEDEDVELTAAPEPELPQPTTSAEPEGLMSPAPSTLSGDEFSLSPDQGYPYPTDVPEAQKPEVEEQPQIDIKSVRQKAEKKYGLTQAQAQELVDSGQATEMDIQLIADSGDDILGYIKDKGYTLTAMGVSEGLSEWAQENKKQLPFDMNFLIRFTIGTLKASQE